MSVIGVIPARYASKRFPGKPLKLIQGKPMIEWVYRSASKALSKVIVATDDKRIEKAVFSFGGKAMMTPRSCKSGTDRMHYVSGKVNGTYFVNVQGDEPFIHASTIKKAVELATQKKAISTVGTKMKSAFWEDRHVVKVIVNSQKKAMYFTRSSFGIRAKNHFQSRFVLKHLGLYVYPKGLLNKFVKFKQPDIEKLEKLEQLRALYNGLPIYVAQTPFDSEGIDTPADLRRLQKSLRTI